MGALKNIFKKADQVIRKSHRPENSAKKTKIIVTCNCGFPNGLYLRGEGIEGLSWDKGTLMTCTKDDEWVWETDADFDKGQIKVLINDKQYELGDNHEIECGTSITFAPKFW